jgi:hypothetical protein
MGELQVIEVTGASVTRGFFGPMNGMTATITGLSPVNPMSSVVLITFHGDFSDGDLCGKMVRASMPGATSITFSRGLGSSGCSQGPIDVISWERIDFGNRALATAADIYLDAGVLSATVQLGGGLFDHTRVLMFSSTPAINGAGNAESGDLSGTSILGEATANVSVGASSATITRGTALAPALFTGQVVQWNP